MQSYSDSGKRRSPGRPRKDIVVRKDVNSPQRRAFGEINLRSRSPGRPRSPGRKNQKVDNKPEISQDNAKFGEGSLHGQARKISRKMNENLTEATDVQEGPSSSVRVIITKAGNSNNNIPKNNTNLQNLDQTPQPVPRDGSLSGDPGTPKVVLVIGDDGFLKMAGNVLPLLITAFLIYIMIMFSAYMHIEPCPNDIAGFIRNIRIIVRETFNTNQLDLNFFIYGSLIFIQYFSYFISSYAADIFKKKVQPDSSMLIHRLPELVSLGIHALLCTSFMFLVYHLIPVLPKMIIENMHQLMTTCYINVGIAAMYKGLSSNSVLQPEELDFLYVRLGAVGSIMVSLTYLWGALFIRPNFEVVLMVMFQVLFMVVFLITRILCPECKSILEPYCKSSLSLAFESFIWMPFGLNFVIRHCFKCVTDFPGKFVVPSLLLQVMLNMMIIFSCFMINLSQRTANRQEVNRVLLSALRQSFEYIAIFVPLLFQPVEDVTGIPPTLIIIYSTMKLGSSFFASTKALKQKLCYGWVSG